MVEEVIEEPESVSHGWAQKRRQPWLLAILSVSIVLAVLIAVGMGAVRVPLWPLAGYTLSGGSLSADQRYDTLNQMQYGGVNRFWEVAVPNGTYQVHLVAGDPNYFTGNIYKINVENAPAINGTPTASNRWIENTVTVTVTDGRLTINNASGGVNNRVCFVDVQQLS